MDKIRLGHRNGKINLGVLENKVVPSTIKNSTYLKKWKFILITE